MSLDLPQISAEVLEQLASAGVRDGDVVDMVSELLADGGLLLEFTLLNGKRVPVAISLEKMVAAIRSAKKMN